MYYLHKSTLNLSLPVQSIWRICPPPRTLVPLRFPDPLCTKWTHYKIESVAEVPARRPRLCNGTQISEETQSIANALGPFYPNSWTEHVYSKVVSFFFLNFTTIFLTTIYIRTCIFIHRTIYSISTFVISSSLYESLM